MNSWGDTIPNLPAGLRQRIASVVERRATLKADLRKATEEEIDLFFEVQRMNLWPRNEGKLHAAAVNAMAPEVLWAAMRRTPGTASHIDPAAGTSSFMTEPKPVRRPRRAVDLTPPPPEHSHDAAPEQEEEPDLKPRM